jgi:hypothetical protein
MTDGALKSIRKRPAANSEAITQFIFRMPLNVGLGITIFSLGSSISCSSVSADSPKGVAKPSVDFPQAWQNFPLLTIFIPQFIQNMILFYGSSGLVQLRTIISRTALLLFAAILTTALLR